VQRLWLTAGKWCPAGHARPGRHRSFRGSRRRNGGPGAVTTIPAAADVGVSVAYGSWHEAWGSLEQLLLNVVLLTVAGAGGLSTQRLIWRRLRPEASEPPG
jgi:Domain of unknown function (DUF389)